jgi:predicted protein tyrosine phosphatase
MTRSVAKAGDWFSTSLDRKTVICLHIPDSYRYMEPALIDELKAALSGLLRCRNEGNIELKQ